MGEVTGKLDNWKATGEIENGMCVIWGNLRFDSKGRFEDGTWLHTSGVKLEDFKEGDVVKTLNSIYLLGEPYKEVI